MNEKKQAAEFIIKRTKKNRIKFIRIIINILRLNRRKIFVHDVHGEKMIKILNNNNIEINKLPFIFRVSKKNYLFSISLFLQYKYNNECFNFFVVVVVRVY